MTDTGCHAALSRARGTVWNRTMSHPHRKLRLATIVVGAVAAAPGRRRRRRAPRGARRARCRRDGAGRGIPRARRKSRRRPRTALRHLDGLRRARDHLHRPRAAAAAAGEPDPLARGGHRRRGRARGRARAAAAAPADSRDRPHRRAPDRRRDVRRRCSTPASPRSCASTARSDARATSRRSRTSRSPRWARERVRDASGDLVDAADGAGRGIHRPARTSREGGPWPSSTAPTACSGCCCSHSHDLSMLLDTADVAAAMSIESQLGTDAVFAADLMALRPQVGQAASAANLRAFLADSPIMASHRDPAVCTRVQDAYSLRCSPQVHGAARDTVGLRPDHRLPRAVGGRRQPGAHRRRPRRVERQLPRRADRVRARLPRDRRRRRRLDLGAPHRPRARSRPQPRPAAVPRARGRRRLGAHDRAVCRCRASCRS